MDNKKNEKDNYNKIIEIIETLCKHNVSTEGLLEIKKNLLKRNVEK